MHTIISKDNDTEQKPSNWQHWLIAGIVVVGYLAVARETGKKYMKKVARLKALRRGG